MGILCRTVLYYHFCRRLPGQKKLLYPARSSDFRHFQGKSAERIYLPTLSPIPRRYFYPQFNCFLIIPNHHEMASMSGRLSATGRTPHMPPLARKPYVLPSYYPQKVIEYLPFPKLARIVTAHRAPRTSRGVFEIPDERHPTRHLTCETLEFSATGIRSRCQLECAICDEPSSCGFRLHHYRFQT